MILVFSHQDIKDLGPGNNAFQLVQLHETTEAALKQAISDISGTTGMIGSYYHFQANTEKHLADEAIFPAQNKIVLKQVFFLAKHLKKSLTQAAATGRSRFMVSTRIDGKLGTDHKDIRKSVAGGYYGLVKTINIEWEEVYCRIVDIDPTIKSQKACKLILNEAQDSDLRIVEAAYDANLNRTTLAALPDETNASTSPPEITPESVFLVSGGAKGVTASCVMELAKQTQCRFILLGRSAYSDNEPEWANGCTEDAELKKRCMNALIEQGEKPTPMKIMAILKPILASREIGKTLAELNSTGSFVEYISVDITQLNALKAAISKASEKIGKITGILHGAGVLADKLIVDKTERDFDSVFSTKIEGLEALLNVVPAESLKHMVLFSSAAGFYGNEAQSDYATANEVLNKFSQAFKKRYPQCHIVSINWGPWDGGMVTPELKRLFQERNISIIPVDVGSQLMTYELAPKNDHITQIVVGNSMIVPRQLTAEMASYTIQRTIKLKENPFLNDHRIGNEPVLPIICSVSWMVDSCERLYPGYQALSAKDVKVLKGIVFSKNTDATVTISLTETEKNEEKGFVVLAVKVSSTNPKGMPIYHYSASVKLSRGEVETFRFTPNLAETAKLDGKTFYENGTLFHGPVFRNVKQQLNFSERHLTLQCETASVTKNTLGQFPTYSFNYVADDADLQALLVWARHTYDAGSLPLSIQTIEFFKPAPFDAEFFVTAKIEKNSSSQIVATIMSHDSDGNTYTKMSGAAVAISQQLNEKFKNS